MSTAEVARPELRHVVLADEADAHIRDASLRVEELEAHLRRVEAEVEAAEERAQQGHDGIELPESAQLTLRFVDDLVSTNRERIRAQLSESHAWAGDRLVEAHAESQAIVNEALAELNQALRERDEASASPGDERSIAELLASISPPAPGPHLPEIPEPPRAAELDRVPDADVLTAGPADPADEPERPATVDDVVSSAVQAVMRALTDAASDSEAPVPSTPAPRGARGDVVDDRGDALSEVSEGSSPADLLVGAARVAGGTGGDGAAEGLADAMGALGDDALSPRTSSFWEDEAKTAGSRESRFRPRDVVISMTVLLVLVILALVFVG